MCRARHRLHSTFYFLHSNFKFSVFSPDALVPFFDKPAFYDIIKLNFYETEGKACEK